MFYLSVCFYSLHAGKFFMFFFSSADFFSKLTFSKTSFRNTIRVSTSFDPVQTRHFVWA